MADEQLRGLNFDGVFYDEAVDLYEPATNWRTELLAQWMEPAPARRWWTLAGTPESEVTQPLTREMLQQASRIVRGRDTDTAEISARRDSINYLLGQMGITPAKTKEKKQEIKRGNPWVQ